MRRLFQSISKNWSGLDPKSAATWAAYEGPDFTDHWPFDWDYVPLGGWVPPSPKDYFHDLPTYLDFFLDPNDTSVAEEWLLATQEVE